MNPLNENKFNKIEYNDYIQQKIGEAMSKNKNTQQFLNKVPK